MSWRKENNVKKNSAEMITDPFSGVQNVVFDISLAAKYMVKKETQSRIEEE